MLTGPALPNVLLLTATPYHATGDLNVYVDAEAIYVDRHAVPVRLFT